MAAAELVHEWWDGWARAWTSTAKHALNELYAIPRFDITPESDEEESIGHRQDQNEEEIDGKEPTQGVEEEEDAADEHSGTESLEEFSHLQEEDGLFTSALEGVVNVTWSVLRFMLTASLFLFSFGWALAHFFMSSWRVLGRYSPTKLERVLLWLILQVPLFVCVSTVVSWVTLLALPFTRGNGGGGTDGKEKSE